MNSVISLTQARRRELFNAAAQELGFNAPVVEKDFGYAGPCASCSPCQEHGTTLSSRAAQHCRRFGGLFDVFPRTWMCR